MLDEEGKEIASLNLKTRDIGSGGAFIYCDEQLAPGTVIDIEMVLPLGKLKELEGKDVLIKISSLVVRKDKEGIGVSFNDDLELGELTEQVDE